MLPSSPSPSSSPSSSPSPGCISYWIKDFGKMVGDNTRSLGILSLSLYARRTRMKATITQIESVVTPSGNSDHVVVPKAWIGKEAVVTLKEKESKHNGKK